MSFHKMLGDDPWAGGEGTFDASKASPSATATLLSTPFSALASLFSSVKNTVTPPTQYPFKPKSPVSVLPVVVAGAAVIGLFVYLSKGKAR